MTIADRPIDDRGRIIGYRLSAIFRGELVRILSWNASGTKAKIATSRGLRWAQRAELGLIDSR